MAFYLLSLYCCRQHNQIHKENIIEIRAQQVSWQSDKKHPIWASPSICVYLEVWQLLIYPINKAEKTCIDVSLFNIYKIYFSIVCTHTCRWVCPPAQTECGSLGSRPARGRALPSETCPRWRPVRSPPVGEQVGWSTLPASWHTDARLAPHLAERLTDTDTDTDTDTLRVSDEEQVTLISAGGKSPVVLVPKPLDPTTPIMHIGLWVRRIHRVHRRNIN